MANYLKKKSKQFHKLMKSGRLQKVCRAAGVVTYKRHTGEDLPKEKTAHA